MTQTQQLPRDWQKDIEMCEGFVADQGWSRRDLIAEQPQMTMYWLQEAKIYKQSYEGTLTAWEAEKARADAAKEILLDAMGIMMAYDVPAHQRHRIIEGVRTLYPDTPAPKEGE